MEPPLVFEQQLSLLHISVMHISNSIRSHQQALHAAQETETVEQTKNNTFKIIHTCLLSGNFHKICGRATFKSLINYLFHIY